MKFKQLNTVLQVNILTEKMPKGMKCSFLGLDKTTLYNKMEEKEPHYLLKLINRLGVTSKEFAESIGLKRPDKIYHVLKYRNGISPGLANEIISRYPEVNYEWLLYGEGEMIKGKFDNNTPLNIDRVPTLSEYIEAVKEKNRILEEFKNYLLSSVKPGGFQHAGREQSHLKGGEADVSVLESDGKSRDVLDDRLDSEAAFEAKKILEDRKKSKANTSGKGQKNKGS